MNKVQNNKAWWLVLPVFLLVAFSAVIPMMTVVNYSVQDIFDQSSRYFVGADWYKQVLLDPRLHDSLLRQFIYSACVLLIEIPLGIGIALTMPTKGRWSSLVLIILAIPLLIPWNVVGNPCTEGNIEGNLGSSKNNNAQGKNGKVGCTCSDECSQRNAKEPESQCATPGHCINAVTNEWRCQTGELGNR